MAKPRTINLEGYELGSFRKDRGQWSGHLEISGNLILVFGLDNCPFCGILPNEVANTHTPCYVVSCDCGAEVTGEGFGDEPLHTLDRLSMIHGRAIHSAIERWNTRADPWANDKIDVPKF